MSLTPRQSVNRWTKASAEGGKAALMHPAQAGRQPRLGAKDSGRIERALKRGPQALGHDTDLWIAEGVVEFVQHLMRHIPEETLIFGDVSLTYARLSRDFGPPPRPQISTLQDTPSPPTGWPNMQ